MVFGAKASHDRKTSPSFWCASPSLRCAILRYCLWPGCSMVFGTKASHDKKTSPSFRCASPSLRCVILRYCLWPGCSMVIVFGAKASQ